MNGWDEPLETWRERTELWFELEQVSKRNFPDGYTYDINSSYGWSDSSSWAIHQRRLGYLTPSSWHYYDPISRLLILALTDYKKLCPNNINQFVFRPEFLQEKVSYHSEESVVYIGEPGGDGWGVTINEHSSSCRWFTTFKSVGALRESIDFAAYFLEHWTIRNGYPLAAHMKMLDTFPSGEKGMVAQVTWQFEWLSEGDTKRQGEIVTSDLISATNVAWIRDDGTLAFLPTKD